MAVTMRIAGLLLAGLSLIGGPVSAQTSTSLQDIAKAVVALPAIMIYTAKEIVTLDPARPSAQAVAVVGDRILAVGDARRPRRRRRAAAVHGRTPTFADQVIVPGFIAQHDHPLLAA